MKALLTAYTLSSQCYSNGKTYSNNEERLLPKRLHEIMEIVFSDCIFYLCWKLIDEVISYVLGQVRKKNTVLVRISLKERAGGRFFGYLLFPIACFFLHIITFPRDTLELISQILIQRNIRCWLNTSLFNFDKHKGLHVTVKIYFISVCTQHQWALQVTPVGFCL